MRNNFFEKDQLKFIYSNKEFLKFIDSYFSSYKMDSIDIQISHGEVDPIDNLKIYIRIILANINDLSDSLKRVEKNISSSFKDKKTVSTGSLRGRLLLGEYVKNKSIIRMPKEYPSIVKNRSLENSENEFIAITIYSVIDTLQDIIGKISKISKKVDVEELKLLNEQLDYFNSVLRQYPFSQIIKFVPIREIYLKSNDDLVNDVLNRINKGKVKNSYAYLSILQWYEKFLNKSLSWIDEENIKMLIYDETFRNKLFEFWCLFKIGDTFKNRFHMAQIGENKLISGQENYIFKFKSLEGSDVEVYYQKGKGLYWDDDIHQDWRYINDEKDNYLIGIPDISVKVVNKTENITLIDIKNKVRDQNQTSEEIYKIIGYFSNFKTYIQEKYDSSYKNQGVLVYRNDINVMRSELENSENRLLALSTGIFENIEMIDKTFVDICKYALNIRGLDGTKSELITSCNEEINEESEKIKRAIVSADDETVEDSLFNLVDSNHKKISAMFSNKNLKEALEENIELLRKNHFPHIWQDMDIETRRVLGMAETLYSEIEDIQNVDYSPICIEYCKAIEKELNNVINTPFKKQHNVRSLILKNRNYDRLKNSRDLTLGECLFLLEACNFKKYPTTELKGFVEKNIVYHSIVLDVMIDKLKELNEDIRRKAAHTSFMTYRELIKTREIVLGIGNENLFYALLDKRAK